LLPHSYTAHRQMRLLLEGWHRLCHTRKPIFLAEP
jgi:hypothetical protein